MLPNQGAAEKSGLLCKKWQPEYVFCSPMKIKTCPDYLGLCGSCRHGSLATTVGGSILVRCDWFDWNVLEPIAICSKYDDRRLPSIHDMRQTAWILKTNADKTAIGFVSNEQWRKSKDYRREFLPGIDD
jgi:hypothetical protein